MDSGRLDGGERVVEDEFTCAGMLRGSLTSLHSTVERIFRVHFAIGTEQSSHDDGQIWLKLRGLKSDVQAAKLFVKGVVNQEEQQEVPYPSTLHCVFCGARGLFMDCLIRTTSALIVIGSPGCLLISGLTEPVVRAYSLITDLVERCESTQTKRMEPGERCPGESLESRRAFKNLVEQWDDRHTLDLLVLPGSVKEVLLELLREARLGDDPGQLLMDCAKQEDAWEKSVLSFRESESNKRWDASLAKDTSSSFLDSFGESESVRGKPEGAEAHSKSPQELSEEEQLDMNEGDEAEGEEQRMQLSGSKEFWLLMKFFTAMGYTEDVVQRVLARTGLQEASHILDFVQQEQDRTDRKLQAENVERTQDGSAANRVEQNRPCETEHKEEVGKRQPVLAKKREIINDSKVNGATGGVAELKDDDFVFGVVKKAAASCGYNEKQVTEAYSMLPDRSMHNLLLELQRIDSKHSGYLKEGPREMDDVVVEKEPPKAAKERFNNKHNVAAESRDTYDKSAAVPNRNGVEEEIIWEFRKEQTKKGINAQKQQNPSADIRGPPMSSYNSNNTSQFAIHTTSQPNNYNATRPLSPRMRKQGFEQMNRNDWSPTRTNERKGPQGGVVVTGEQRFLEGLHSRFELRLTDCPGNGKLRNIIIDGSNVAMSHGLGHFFSCRGIALAVQHFWDRGHRQISVLVPQWRTKIDPKIKEQHYLTELKELGIVSFTPSREVQGKRISSYDDRLMLQLAQKTDGVIVTNDNLRDLSDETPVWRDIIKKRLLQYTFVGDLIMIPDDPLGRGGPHLDEFLSSDQRSPDPGGHIHSNISAPFPSSKATRPQADLMNHRDPSPGGALWEHRGSSSRRGKDPTAGLGQDWARPGPEPGIAPAARAERSPEETARLRDQLCQVFPGQDNVVTLLLQSHPSETDINTLSALLLEEN